MGPFLLEAFHLALALQAVQATVAGTVRDQTTGQPLAGAIVVLTDLNRGGATDSEGRYALRGVPPGPQHLTVRFLGYAQRALHVLVPAEGELEINVTLEPEPFRLSTLEVELEPAVRGLESGDSAPALDRRASISAIRNHPLLAEPDALLALEGGTVVTRPESPSGVHVRGGAPDHTGYLLDGFPVFSPYHAAGLFSAWNPDALSAVEIASSFPLFGHSNSLAGTIAATTRSPGSRFGAQGSLSTTQARMSIDGGLGRGGAGYLFGFRTGVPGSPLPDRDPSYLRSESSDWLAKLESPLFGGRARLLAYGTDSEIDAAARVEAIEGRVPRHDFEWGSRSIGAGWDGKVAGAGVSLRGWSAEAHAGALWWKSELRAALASSRRDIGVLAGVELGKPAGRTSLGVRFERSRTRYLSSAGDNGQSALLREASTPVGTFFGRYTGSLGRQLELSLGGSLAAADRGLHFGPHLLLRGNLSSRLVLTGSYARLHQFAQSLRNAESVVGNIFPADLYVAATTPGVGVARSDLITAAAQYRPGSGLRLELETFHRRSRGLVLVAPREGGPFAAGDLATGSGTATGVALDAALSRTHFGVVGSYGWQRVRLRYEGGGYVPGYGSSHLLHGGIVVFPSATWSLKLGATAELGRRTTAALGGLEWEACNLLDRGCEFSGSPDHTGQPLGATTLPHYFRLDLGVRKHWHFEAGGRDVMVALFGTITNLLGRTNVLTYVRDPLTGEAAPVEMRPLAPLLVGLDWRY